MGRTDITLFDSPYGHATYFWSRASRAAGGIDTVQALTGEPLKGDTTTDDQCVRFVDADHTIGTDGNIIGVAYRDSTETLTAVGNVEVLKPLPGIEYAIRANVATAADTETEVNALRGDAVTVALSATDSTGVYTLNTTHADTSAFVITGGDFSLSVLYFVIRTDGTIWGRARV